MESQARRGYLLTILIIIAGVLLSLASVLIVSTVLAPQTPPYIVDVEHDATSTAETATTRSEEELLSLLTTPLVDEGTTTINNAERSFDELQSILETELAADETAATTTPIDPLQILALPYVE